MRFKRSLAFIICFVLIMTAMSASAAGYMYTGASKKLVSEATAAKLSWKISDESVISLSGGTVTALKPGKATVYAALGKKVKSADVVVIPRNIELTAGETYALPRAGGEKYRTSSSKVASVSSKGVIKAVSAGTAVIRVKASGQTLYINVTVTACKTDQSRAASLDCASSCDQIVLVEYTGGSCAVLSVHEKRDGIWTELASCGAYVGKNGIGKTKEGDMKTPSGTYALTFPFGIKADPGSSQGYLQVTKYHYWCATSTSEYYNRLIDIRKSGVTASKSDEHLSDIKGYYDYCMLIDYNSECTPGKGSCIFLHCKGSKKYTSGCIAIDKAYMKQIIKWAKPGCKIVIKQQ